MLKKIFIFIFLTLYAYADYGDAIEKAFKEHKIKISFIDKIIKVESSGKNNVVSAFSRDTAKIKRAAYTLKRLRLTVYENFSSGRNFIRIENMDRYDAELVFEILDAYGINYDVGLMQINRVNLKKLNITPVDALLDTHTNINLGVLLFKQCYYHFRDTKMAIECYNKGTDSSKFGNYSYFRKVAGINSDVKKERLFE